MKKIVKNTVSRWSLVACFLSFSFAGFAGEDIGLWGYVKKIRLCENANELFQAYVDVNKIPALKKAVASKEERQFTISVSFPQENVVFVGRGNDNIWLFPKWASNDPDVKQEVKDGKLIIYNTFSSGTAKIAGGRYGFGFVTNTVKRGAPSAVTISLAIDGKIIATHEYELETLPPIKGAQPKSKLVQIAYYPQFTNDLMKETFARNTIDAGFNDLMVVHNGSDWAEMKDVAMMRDAGMRVVANFFTSGIFKKFPFEKYLSWNETDGKGKIRMRHRDLEMQRIINKEPVIIDYLVKYFANLKKVYNIDAIQMDEERSPDGGYTEIGMAAFKKWAGIADEIKLSPTKIKSDYWEMWIAFRNRQVALTFDVLKSCATKACGKIPMGYYGAPQVVRGKNYEWARNHYVAGWRLLRNRADWGGAGYDFSMRSMRNTYEALGKGRFIPWYMVTENYNERWRRYRKISANLMNHLIASGMNGYAIWYYILDNGAFYDISLINNFLAENEDILSGENETPALLALENPPQGDYPVMVYSKSARHVAVLVNLSGEEYHSKYLWRGCERQPETVVRRENGEKAILPSDGKIVIPPRSFVSLTATYNVTDVDASSIKRGMSFEAVFDKPGVRSFNLENSGLATDCEVSAEISVTTDSKDFGEFGITIRDSEGEKILGGFILSKGVLWARARDMGQSNKSTNSNYIRHTKDMKNQQLILSVRKNVVTLKVGARKFTYNTEITKAGKIGFFIKANAPGKCVIRDFKLLKSEQKVEKKNKRKKRELRKDAPQV